MIGGQPYCWCECMRLWGPQMSDLPNCTSRADEGTDAIYNLGGAGPGAPMAPAISVKRMSVDEKNRAIRARAVAEAKK